MALECPTLQQIEKTLADLLSNERFPLEKLGESARYATLAGGKRLRPRLVIATAEMYGAPLEKALYPACALELIHTYSLIHDDLPCMDNDDFRRGRPSVHKAYSEEHALLTGDFLLTYAFQVLSESPGLSSDQKLALIHTLSIKAGLLGMIGGQESDLAISSKEISWENLLSIHKKKTAALITAALEFGGILGDSSQLETLRLIGEKTGVAFQILDDLADPDDLDKERPSILNLLTSQKAKSYADNLIESALTLLKSLPSSSHSLQMLIEEIRALSNNLNFFNKIKDE